VVSSKVPYIMPEN